MKVSAFSQTGYPKMIVSDNGDTIAMISIEQVRQLNHMKLELQMTYEIIDSLVANDSLHFVKELYLQQIIQKHKERYANLEKQNQVDLKIKDIEIEDLKKRKNKNILKGVVIGSGLSFIVWLITK